MDELLNGAPCGFLSFSDDGIVELANGTLLEMLGYERGEVVGSHVERLMPVRTRIFYQTHWFPLLRLHGQADVIFLMLRAKGGEDVATLVNAVRHDRDGSAKFDCALIRVRERQKYEDELLRARRAAEKAQAELEVQARDLRHANSLLEGQAVELDRRAAASSSRRPSHPAAPAASTSTSAIRGSGSRRRSSTPSSSPS